ncbi:hypothetical protein DIJ64_14200 [Mycobacterium leprae]|uniref:Uncharacterized protein n=1 Tax=Mycobacterium leprae TaxID=1769 RepID=A0AAD0KTQ4_MYCLR|nr:hypothetical protein [Mycobacterium leprae]AWV48795.1 hypothetical protein DIJ64_14200 [Mycobacterium leprae]OAX71238.1 hypothetical protein A3216_07115 [Mycobacterium leprae 7935681]
MHQSAWANRFVDRSWAAGYDHPVARDRGLVGNERSQHELIGGPAQLISFLVFGGAARIVNKPGV